MRRKWYAAAICNSIKYNCKELTMKFQHPWLQGQNTICAWLQQKTSYAAVIVIYFWKLKSARFLNILTEETNPALTMYFVETGKQSYIKLFFGNTKKNHKENLKQAYVSALLFN